MWLLNTARAELKFFSTPESVPSGYAILSHVWDEHEQTFQEIQALRVQCAADGTNPRDLVCDKIRRFCVLAERGGHEWGWADMCCIDKTSSTELSEAVVSMYRYYSLADVCYAYLRDVLTSSEDDLRARESAFRKSRWFKRGWTLQELIAPVFIVFVSQTWEVLGAKADLADVLEEVTRVPAAVLKLEVGPSAYSVAARMSWAAGRATTRPEDEAYCLMGIFGIFMPPLYGEGRNAFLRLQEEITRQVDDPSIFAWGRTRAGNPTLKWIFSADLEQWDDPLFASAPSDFLEGNHIKRCPERPRARPGLLQKLLKWKRPANLSKLPTFIITPYGVMAHLPVFASSQKGLLVGLLVGIQMDMFGVTTENVGLLLREVESPDHTRQLYVPSSYYWKSALTRLMALEGDPLQMARGTKITLEWRTIYIVRNPPATRPLVLPMVNRSLNVPFHIPQSEIARLLEVSYITTYSISPPKSDLSREGPMVFQIYQWTPVGPMKTVIYLGLCAKSPLGPPQHWAKTVEYRFPGEGELEEGARAEHVCARHYVNEHSTQTHPLTIYNRLFKSVSTERVCLELSLGPYPFSSMHCLKVSIRFNSTEHTGSADGESTGGTLSDSEDILTSF